MVWKINAVFTVVGDFNRANISMVSHKYFQHITVTTLADPTLDHCYMAFKGSPSTSAFGTFGNADHSSILLPA